MKKVIYIYIYFRNYVQIPFTNGFFFKKATPYKSFFLNKNKVSPIADVIKQVRFKNTNGAADLNK